MKPRPTVAPRRPDRSATPAGAAACIGLLTVFVFMRAVTCGFVDYDDGDYVTANPHVQAGWSIEGLRRAFTSGHAANWHPLTWLSHMTDVAWFGLRPAGHHLTSVLLHAINAALLFLLLLRVTGRLWPAVFGALAFAWHPLRVESVVWISERKDVLSLMFGLITLLAWARAVQPPGGSGQRRFHLAAVLSYAAALMSKPTLVTLPFVLLLLDFWPFRRTPAPAGSASPARSGIPVQDPIRHLAAWWPLIREKAPFFVLALASSVVTYLVQKSGGAVAPETALSWPARLANVPVSYARYLAKTLLPQDLAVLYPHPLHWPAGTVIGCTVLCVGLTTWAWAVRHRRPHLWVGWAWFCGALVPMIGIVQVGIQSMADRYTYWPSVGLSLALAAGWARADKQPRSTRTMASTIACALLLAWAGLTWRQIGFWKNSETLFRRALAVTRNNELAHNNLGYAYARQGRWQEAIAEYRAALAIRPQYPDALNNLGHALTELGRPAEALPHLENAVRLRPRDPAILNNLGNALADLGRLDEAERAYRRALEIAPDHADAHNNLGVTLAMQRRFEEAIRHLRDAVRLRPGHAPTHSNLGNALAALGRFAEAEQAYRRALTLDPEDARTYNNLGNVLIELGRWTEAEAAYMRALELKPDNAETHFNLAQLRLRQGRREEARRHLKEVLRLRPDHAEARAQWQRLESPDSDGAGSAPPPR